MTRKSRRRTRIALIAVFGILAIGVTWFIFRDDDLRLPEHSWLEVRVPRDLPDRRLPSLLGEDDQRFGMLELKRGLRIARTDPRLQGILFVLPDEGVPPQRVAELTHEVDMLRAHQKSVVVFARRYPLSSWTVATHADSMSLHPMGSLDVRRPRMMAPFFGRALEQFGLRADTVWLHEDLGAHEQLVGQGPGEALRGQLDELHRRHWAYVESLLARKNLGAIARVRESGGTLPAQFAIEEEWVDQIEDHEEFRQRVVEGGHLVDFSVYRSVRPSAGLQRNAPEVAVLSLEGILVDGDSRELPLYGRFQGVLEVERGVQEILETPSIRAVIVHINSPGGEVFASDEVRRQLDRLQNDLPVVAVLGSQATSGGYYAALACEQIFAKPETITGSISAVGGRLVARDLLTKVGVDPFTFGGETDGDGNVPGSVSSGAPPVRALSGTAPSRWESYRDEDRATMQRDLAEQFAVFEDKVQASRGVTEPKAVCDGRLFFADEALTDLLIDGLGGFPEAWREICDNADIEPERASFEIFPRKRGIWQRVVEGDLAEPPPSATDALAELTRERGWFLGPLLDWK